MRDVSTDNIHVYKHLSRHHFPFIFIIIPPLTEHCCDALKDGWIGRRVREGEGEEWKKEGEREIALLM